MSRSRSTHALKSRESSPVRTSSSTVDTDKDGAALSSWARYLKNKYGSRTTKDSTASDRLSSSTAGTSSTSSALASSSTPTSSASRRLSLGLPLRQANEIHSSDDDSKNGLSSPTSPTVGTGVGTSPRTQYLQKRRQLFQIGGRGSEQGTFTWPRGNSKYYLIFHKINKN